MGTENITKMQCSNRSFNGPSAMERAAGQFELSSMVKNPFISAVSTNASLPLKAAAEALTKF